VNFYSEHQRVPNRREIVEAYYGEYIPPASFFIGFDRPSVFDMPLISTGAEDLYFTVSPSPYLDRQTLRSILYDHLFSRRLSDDSYGSMSPKDWEVLKRLYDQNRTSVIGLGRQHKSGKFWYPLPQIVLPPQLEED
jgi:tuberculosinol/isotuberculosinol synthase